MRAWQGVVFLLGWMALAAPVLVHAESAIAIRSSSNKEKLSVCGSVIDPALSNHLDRRLLFSKLVHGNPLSSVIGSASAAEFINQPEPATISTVDNDGRRFFWCAWQSCC